MHSEDQALLKAYIFEWRKFFDQCSYLPKPFSKVEDTLNNQNSTNPVPKKHKNEDNDVRKVREGKSRVFFRNYIILVGIHFLNASSKFYSSC